MRKRVWQGIPPFRAPDPTEKPALRRGEGAGASRCHEPRLAVQMFLDDPSRKGRAMPDTVLIFGHDL